MLVSRKTATVDSKLTQYPLLDDANQIFYSATKNANFMLLETLRGALTEPNIAWLPAPPENHFHSNQICF